MGTPSLLTLFIIKDTFFFQECKVRATESASKKMYWKTRLFSPQIPTDISP